MGDPITPWNSFFRDHHDSNRCLPRSRVRLQVFLGDACLTWDTGQADSHTSAAEYPATLECSF